MTTVIKYIVYFFTTLIVNVAINSAVFKLLGLEEKKKEADNA